MEIIRIGEKIISREKIARTIDRMLELRKQGLSQQEVANRLNLERTFVSRVEGIGEIRKGERIAVVGFPIQNKGEIIALLKELGVEYTLIMTESERWKFVRAKNGADLLNELMNLIATIRTYDTVVLIGSNMRIKLGQALLDKEVVGLEIGESPIEEDKYVDPAVIRKIIETCQS